MLRWSDETATVEKSSSDRDRWGRCVRRRGSGHLELQAGSALWGVSRHPAQRQRSDRGIRDSAVQLAHGSAFRPALAAVPEPVIDETETEQMALNRAAPGAACRETAEARKRLHAAPRWKDESWTAREPVC